MNRYRSVSLALTALAVLLSARLAAASQEVPFNGSFEGVVTHAPVDAVTDSVLV